MDIIWKGLAALEEQYLRNQTPESIYCMGTLIKKKCLNIKINRTVAILLSKVCNYTFKTLYLDHIAYKFLSTISQILRKTAHFSFLAHCVE